MRRDIMAGLDGSSEGRAAAEWAAREAELHGLPLRLIHVQERVAAPVAREPVTVGSPLLRAGTRRYRADRLPRDAAEGLRLRHPGVAVTQERIPGQPAQVLLNAAKDAALLVLGSRGLSGLGGFLVGSVSMAVIAHVEVPVVLVRAHEQAADEHAPDATDIPSAATAFRPVVLGLDLDSPDGTVIAFAFEEAARRDTALHVVHSWNLPPFYVYGVADGVERHDETAREKAAELTRALLAWRARYPAVEVVELSRTGNPACHLVDAARTASLVVVGRRIHRGPVVAQVGPVTHALLHHAPVPVAVVAHD